MQFFTLIFSLLLTSGFLLSGCAVTGGAPTLKAETEIKYFHGKKLAPEPGVDIVRLTAAVRGKLNIKNNCLMIGPHVPIFAEDLIIARDRRGLFVQHEKGGRKYRVGDRIKGGGGYSSGFNLKPKYVDAKNGASVDVCEPQIYRWRGESETGSYVSFWMSDPK